LKIKCPLCPRPTDDFDGPEHYEAYHRLLLKIHEKLESLQNRIDALNKDNRLDQYVATQLEILEGKQQELKSLLENKK
jgi:hypothetical protein